MLQVLQISTTILVSFAGIIFASAEGAPLGAVSVLVALFSLFFIDWQKDFYVTTFVASILGFCAFIAAGIEFFNGEIESRLLSGGHLIVYLTWIFLVQKKENRHFWWLFALGMLQVAVSAVLTNALWYGAALVGYTFLACWTLSVFQLYRATNDHIASALLTNQPRLIVGSTRKGLSRDVDHNLLNFRFFSTTSFVYVLSFGMAMLFFLFTPRVWIGQYSIYGDSPVSGKALTGFTEEVRLGDMGEILENNATVATVELYHHQTGIRFTEREMLDYFGSEPLFRGSTQEIYELGNWSHFSQTNLPMTNYSETAKIRQQIELEPIGIRTLFGFGNIVALSTQSEQSINQQPYSKVFSRRGGRDSRSVFTYEVLSNPGKVDLEAALERLSWSVQQKWEFREYLNRLSRPRRSLSRISELSRNITRNSTTQSEIASQIEAYLRDSGEFSYSLKLDIQDASIDPVEDFLINRKQGHCEYFASAMALMLRGNGIPARLVTGFKGGVQNKDTLTLQQLHAHSWVEAYIDDHWQTFDPTPGERNDSVSSLEGPRSMYVNMKQGFLNYWNAGINMSPTQQKEMIYKPVEGVVSKVGTTLKEVFDGNLTSVKQYFEFLKSPRQWVSWQGGVFVFLVLLFVSGLVWSLKKISRLLMRNWKRQLKQQRTYQQVEFYNRFRKIMHTQGYSQKPAETAQEFVTASLKTLQTKFVEVDLEHWPEELVQKFYQVRFGNQPLSEQDAEQIQARLTKMESALLETK